MKSEPSLEFLGPQHAGILAAAALDGCNLEAVVPGAHRLVGYGDTKHGYGPACVIDLVSTEYVMEPHVIWFPWTTTANKIVNFKWAMGLMAQTHHVLLNVQKDQAKFFDHFVKRGYMRKVGVIEDLPEVEEIHMYQIKRGQV